MSTITAIITRTKNRPLLLSRAIRSVLGQTTPHWVHVIVNDGGNPSDVEGKVKPYLDAYAGRLILVNHPQSLGMEAASNAGIRASLSDYILIHDDDDTLEPEFLSVTMDYLDNVTWSTVQGVATLANRVDEIIDGDSVIEISRSMFSQINSIIGIKEMAKTNQFTNNSFLFRRSVLNEIGWFDESLPVLGDWDFNLRFIVKYDIGVVQKPLSNYHNRPSINEGSMGNTIYAEDNLHEFYDILLRNRYMRDQNTQHLGVLMCQQGHCGREEETRLRILRTVEKLYRLYRYPIVFKIIKSFTKWF